MLSAASVLHIDWPALLAALHLGGFHVMDIGESTWI